MRRTLQAFALLAAASSATATDESEMFKSFLYEDGRIEFEARNVPATDVIKFIGERADFEVTIHGPVDTVVSGRHGASSIEGLLKNLGVQHILVLDPADDDGRVEEVILLSEGADGSEFLNDGTVQIVDEGGESTHSQAEDSGEIAADEPAVEPEGGFGFVFDPNSFDEK